MYLSISHLGTQLQHIELPLHSTVDRQQLLVQSPDHFFNAGDNVVVLSEAPGHNPTHSPLTPQAANSYFREVFGVDRQRLHGIDLDSLQALAVVKYHIDRREYPLAQAALDRAMTITIQSQRNRLTESQDETFDIFQNSIPEQFRTSLFILLVPEALGF